MHYITTSDLIETLEEHSPSTPVRIANGAGLDLRIAEIIATPTGIVLIPEPTDEEPVSAGKLDIVEVDAGWQITYITRDLNIAVGAPLDDLLLAESVVRKLYSQYPEFLMMLNIGNGATDTFVDSLSSPSTDDPNSQ